MTSQQQTKQYIIILSCKAIRSSSLPSTNVNLSNMFNNIGFESNKKGKKLIISATPSKQINRIIAYVLIKLRFQSIYLLIESISINYIAFYFRNYNTIKMKNIVIICLAYLAIGCNKNTKEPGYSADETAFETKKINTFFSKSFDAGLDRSPEYQSYMGIKKDQDKWDDISDDFAKKELEIDKAELQWIKDSINYDALSREAKISYALFVAKKETTIANFKYRYHNYPINQMFGPHAGKPAMLINMHSISSATDAEAYISRLKGIKPYFDQLILNLKTRESKGISPPKFVYPRVIQACENLLKGAPFSTGDPSPLFADFIKKIDALEIEENDKNQFIEKSKNALLDSVQPSYLNLIGFLKEQEQRASNDDGAWKFPEGNSFYNAALKNTTTTNLTSNEIHETGLKEVARIHGEMSKIMKQVNFEGDLQAFFQFLREDDQFYYPNTDEGKIAYMDSATSIINTMKSQLDKLFITKPKAEMIVKRVEVFREKSAGKAFYNQASKDRTRPGTYYANMANTKNMPKFEMEALAYHEGIPGHHMQISIAQELEGIPDFRKYGRYTAYVEGWGLYCEFIPKEMGFYQNPYSDYGRLSMELWRACRLVVDTGIHEKKWTREEGISYYVDNTSSSERECVRMVERHIVMPSQATAYKIGMLKILELRAIAQEKLGDSFDIREFHEVVLTSGPVPLDLLEKMINNWIKSKA
jgi:uncharacterized protein (DUF885 family)